MKAVRCPNGHWYDSETYDKCPHCGRSGSATQIDSDNIEKSNKKSFSLFKKNKKNKNNTKNNIEQKKTQDTSIFADEIKTSTSVTQDTSAIANEPKRSTSVTQDEITERFFADIDDEKTVSMFEANDMLSEKHTAANTTKKSVSEPLADAIHRVSAMDEGKTLSYFNSVTSQRESVTVSKTVEPVVGWLVAISGVHLGESFELYVGKNTIGRNTSNKVVLALDKSVSRENHATIIYEPKRREFYLQSGNSDRLIYLNDAFVNSSQLIKENDILELGTSKLIFIPLCGTGFSWEQYM